MNRDRLKHSSIFALALGFILVHAPQILHAQEPSDPLLAEAESLKVDLESLRREYTALGEQLPGLSGQDSVIVQREMVKMLFTALEQAHKLGSVFARLEEKGDADAELRGYVVEIFQRVPQALRDSERDINAQLVDLRAQLGTAAPGDLGLLQEEITDLESRLDELQEHGWRHIEILEQVGQDTAPARARLKEFLEKRAQFMAGRLELSMEERQKYQAQAKQYPDDAAFGQRAVAAQLAVDGGVKSLEHTIAVMEKLGIDVTEYRTLLVDATGELARGLSDAKVAVSLVQRWSGEVRDWLKDNGPGAVAKILLFILILLAFRAFARIVRKVVIRSIDSSRFQPSQLMRNMITNIVGNLVLAFGLLVALSQVGVSLGPLLAGLGVAGFILGFALQDTLANFAAGVMILFYRPFDVGDMVEAAGVQGKVSHMSLVSTTVLTIDNQTLIVPNGKIWGDVIRNVTAQTMRRVDMVFGISYSDDIPHAESVLRSILDEHDKVLDDPAPNVKLHELADSSVNFIVRPWVKTDDYWEVYWDVTREVKMRFDREGINIPFPQRDVHLYEQKG